MIDTRFGVLALALLAGILATACGDSQYLAVDLRTDYAAGVEYDEVEVSVDGLTRARIPARTDAGDRPHRVFERDDLVPGVHALEVSLRLGATRIATRRVQFSLRGSRVVSVVITRDCREVGCPGTGATECLGGRCVAPECTTLGEPGCSEAECSTGADCTASVACAAGACVEGACLEVPVVDACGASMVCVPERGCVGVAPSDAGGTDAGTGPIDTGSVPFDGGGPSGPYAPVAPATNSVWTVQGSASPPIAIGASDADGDLASYEVLAGTGPLRGGVSFAGDSFVFTPTAGAAGSDGFTIRISDTGGRFVDQVVSVSIVTVPSPTDWRYFAGEGESVTLGGRGELTGTNGLQEIVLADVPGVISFDPSFNRGNDIVRLPGNAADWRAVSAAAESGSIVTDGSIFALIPAGATGLALVFDDGTRVLRTASGRVEIGSQTLTDVYLPITAPPEAVTLPSGIEPAVRGRMFMLEGGSAVVRGRMDLFGTNGLETVVLLGGDVQFDASFNRGGDSIVFPDSAPTYEGSLSGSRVDVESSGLVASIPVGLAGMSLVFTDATHSLRIVGSDVLIGRQVITATPAPLTSA